ncbi:hypothetical protein ACG33_02295 [Steroidobacter denitrificans]|uniref:Uncharacterized protein n=1 Tax=Steroidobacter denitrificans TaxID=465721 RepID=A0A127F8S0_STEDE|nr:hypothetical protein [Steroidobacter denitrificans]AMN45960.1 hypothetical protein ACG33_02295 [Steroidobacter denitrificans]
MDRKALKLAAALAFAVVSWSAQAECIYPKAPATIPDGATATEGEMIAAMNAFKTYNNEVTEFGACLEEETKSKAAGTAQLMQMKTMQAKKHNAAIAELQEKAKAFNEQVRIFKAKS